MSRWSLLALVTLTTALAGGYALFSRPGLLERDGARRAEAELGVEEFEPEEGGGDEEANAEAEGDGGAPKPATAARPAGGRTVSRPKAATAGGGESNVETIEDEDMLGETIDEPLVIEDEDEQGTVEVAPPAPTAP